MSVSDKYIVNPAQGYDDDAMRRSLSERSATLLNRAWADKSGLGTVAGVSIAAVLAYAALKAGRTRAIAQAARKGVPLNMNIVNPLLGVAGGIGLGAGGKYLFDKYNKSEDKFIY